MTFKVNTLPDDHDIVEVVCDGCRSVSFRERKAQNLTDVQVACRECEAMGTVNIPHKLTWVEQKREEARTNPNVAAMLRGFA